MYIPDKQLGGIDGFFDEFISNTVSSTRDIVASARTVAPDAIRLSFAAITAPVMSARALVMGEGKEGVVQAVQTTVTDPARKVATAAAPILPYVPYGNIALLMLTLDQLRARRAAEADNEREQAAIQKEINAIEAKIAALENGKALTANSTVGAQSALQSSQVQAGGTSLSPDEKKPLPWGAIATAGAIAAAALLS